MEKIKSLFTKTLFICFILFSVGMLVAQIVRAETTEFKSVGMITFVTGDVNIIHANKTTAKAVKNDALTAGDTIETKTGRLQLSLIDGGKVSLQPNTIYKITKYEFSGKEDGSEYAFTELVKGGMRTISGLIGHKNRDRYQLKTAVATIGIRGTEFTLNFNNNQLLMTTNHGSVDVCNAGGCLNAVTGQSIAVAGLGAAPKPSSKAAKAAAAPPASSKAVFAAGEEVSAVVASTAITTPTATTPPLPNNNNRNNYSGFLSTVMKTACNCGFDGVYNAQIETDNNAKPTKLSIARSAEIRPIAFSSVNNDGIIGWGRIMPGTLTNAGVSNSIEWMDYAIGAKPDPAQLANLTGTYTVFGSTAPMLLSTGGISAIIGAENAVVGNFTFNFATTNFSYGITVNTITDSFILAGGGNLSASNPTFFSNSGQSSITSLGATCTAGACSTALNANRLIQGAFFGQNGERIGLQYGFNVPIGAVYGTAVLK